MNHSIHSADRSTHLKIVVVALVAGIAVAALRDLGAHQFGLQPDRPGRQGRQGDDGDQLGTPRWSAKHKSAETIPDLYG